MGEGNHLSTSIGSPAVAATGVGVGVGVDADAGAAAAEGPDVDGAGASAAEVFASFSFSFSVLSLLVVVASLLAALSSFPLSLVSSFASGPPRNRAGTPRAATPTGPT